MSETYRRVAGDQLPLGYRQLPSAGSEGLDLKTLVYAGLGVALGILVGTVLADGSWRTPIPMAQHKLVQPVSGGSGPADLAAAKPAPASPPQPQSTTHQSPKPSLTPQLPATPSSAGSGAADRAAAKPVQALQAQAATHETPKPSLAPQQPATLASAGRSSSAVRGASLAQVSSSTHKSTGTRDASLSRIVPGSRNVPAPHRILAAHRRRPVHGMAAWRRHFSRRSAFRRHRLRNSRRAAIKSALLPAGLALRPVNISTASAFTVEGELSVSGYDGSKGTIETYEGEAFALARPADPGLGIHGAEITPNIHYRCDQFGSCTLVAGQFVLNAKRTK